MGSCSKAIADGKQQQQKLQVEMSTCQHMQMVALPSKVSTWMQWYFAKSGQTGSSTVHNRS
jgi:hypothetical protein